MADYDHLLNLPGKAASQINYGVVVTGDTTTGGQVIPAASINQLPLGLSIATVGTTGIGMTFCRSGKAKAIVAASVGPWSPVGVASANGAIGPIVASAVASSANGSGVRYQVGIVDVGGQAGQIVSVILDPRQIV